MTELEIYKAPRAEVATTADLDDWVKVVQEVSRLADAICGTSFVPKAYRNDAPAVMAAILAGRELGLPPMTSLRHVQVVEGSPGLSAEYKRACVLSAGHKLDVSEHTTEACEITGHRKGHKPVTVRFTMADARRAGIVKARGAWETRPRRMLFARACTEVCDALFADITNGLPTAELLEQDGDGASGYDEQPAEAARPTGRVSPAEITGRAAATQTASPAEQHPPAAAPHSLAAEPAGETPKDSAPHGAATGTDGGSTASTDSRAVPNETTYDTPGTVTQPPLTAIWTLMTGAYGFTQEEKPQARAVCAHIIGRELASTKDMSKNEARKVLDQLATWRATADERNEAPRDYLLGVMVAGAEAGDA